MEKFEFRSSEKRKKKKVDSLSHGGSEHEKETSMVGHEDSGFDER